MLTLLPVDPPARPDQQAVLRQRAVGRGSPLPWATTAKTEARRARLREVGARLFAARGIDRVSMMEVALTAGISFYTTRATYLRRRDLIFDILYAFIDGLHEYVGMAEEAYEAALPSIRLEGMIAALLDGMADQHHAHQVMRSAYALLPEAMRSSLTYQMRTLEYRLRAAITAALPALAEVRHLQAPLAHSLLAMASQAPFWLKDDGALSRDAYARFIALSILEGGKAMLAEGVPVVSRT